MRQSPLRRLSKPATLSYMTASQRAMAAAGFLGYRCGACRVSRSRPMATISEADVLGALGRVVDPDRKRDVVSLGMVSGLVVRDGHVGFALEVDPKRGPMLEPLRKAAEDAVEKLPGVLSVTAVL